MGKVGPTREWAAGEGRIVEEGGLADVLLLLGMLGRILGQG